MVSFTSLISAASVVVVALAQTPKIAFSSIPSVAQAGQSYNVTWGGGDGYTPITLTLRKGDPNSLSTVGVIGDRLQGYSYLWNVSALLATGDDYALQITQGQSDINYSGQFSIVGGTGSVTISYSGLITSTANSSITTTTTGGISMGTGTTMERNNTFVPPTMSAPTTTESVPASTTTAAATTTTSGNAANTMGSSAALVMGLFGAVMFLQ